MSKVILIMTLITMSSSVIFASDNAIPLHIQQSKEAALVIYLKQGYCSATRIDKDLVLSAAHCLLGQHGEKSVKKNGSLFFSIDGSKHELKVVDVGDFKPPKNKMQDWVVLSTVEKDADFGPVTIATFPNKEEWGKIISNLGSFEPPKTGRSVWSISYPSFMLRSFPRKGNVRKQIFLSKGYLKTDDAYKRYVLTVYSTHQIFDEIFASSFPKLEPFDVQKWDDLAKAQVFGGVHDYYNKYENDDDPIIYHTADYSFGSSGGGIFDERTGHYLGMIILNQPMTERNYAFDGISLFYRVDKICKQSKILNKTKQCQALLGE